ncbi:hypothetical protein [Photobacterium damselae]|uniref:hypothetical protein n=1 Tax=Photobacterium damselae TaxID=38293 RepID=UPI003B67EBB3
MLNSILLLISLLLSTKFMILSIYSLIPYALLLANVCNFLIILDNYKKVLCLSNERKYAVIFFTLSLCVINISKLNDSISIGDVIYPTDIHLLLSLIAILVLSKKNILLTVKWYLNVIAIICFLGLVAYICNYLNIIDPTGLVVAPDHAKKLGYASLYGIAYYPSWIHLPFGFTRFASVFWEPGTFGLYLIFLLCIEYVFFQIEKERRVSILRISIFLISGMLSFSALFYIILVILIILTFNWFKTRNILLLCLCTMIFLLLFNQLYELILYRLSYDPDRGFVGNNRSGAFSFYLDAVKNGSLINALFGFGPNAEFNADSTPIFIKFFQRGIIGGTLLLLGYLSLAINSGYRKLLLVMLLSFVALAQIEGALSLLFFILAVLGLSDDNQSKRVVKCTT